MIENQEQHLCCRTYRYWEQFNGACCNYESEHCADFTDEETTCATWKWMFDKKEESDT